MTRDLAFESRGCGDELVAPELIGARGRAFHDRRQPAAVAEKGGGVFGRDFLRGEARAVDHPPETIAAPGEMMAGRRSLEPRIDPAEQDVEIIGDDVGQDLRHCMLHGSRQAFAAWLCIVAI